MTNPFTPPSARVSDGPPEKGSPYKAVLFGLLVDWGGTLVAGVVLSILYGAMLASSGMPPEDIEVALRTIPADSWVSLLGMAVGAGFSGLGGYVCARVAKHNEFALGAVLALLSVAFGLVVGAGQYSLLEHLGLSALSFVAVMFGVRFGAARNGVQGME
jgi:hypothetical protein